MENAKTKYLSPAEYVIRTFNGITATANALGCHPTAISKWRAPKESGGSAGLVPGPVLRRILLIAKERGLDITPADLIWGRTIEERQEAAS